MKTKINKLYDLQIATDNYKEKLKKELEPFIDFSFDLQYEYNQWVILCDELALSLNISYVLDHIKYNTKLTMEYVEKTSVG